MFLMIFSAAGIELSIGIMADMGIPLFISFVIPQVEDFLEFVNRTIVFDGLLSSRYRFVHWYHARYGYSVLHQFCKIQSIDLMRQCRLVKPCDEPQFACTCMYFWINNLNHLNFFDRIRMEPSSCIWQ